MDQQFDFLTDDYIYATGLEGAGAHTCNQVISGFFFFFLMRVKVSLQYPTSS